MQATLIRFRGFWRFWHFLWDIIQVKYYKISYLPNLIYMKNRKFLFHKIKSMRKVIHLRKTTTWLYLHQSNKSLQILHRFFPLLIASWHKRTMILWYFYQEHHMSNEKTAGSQHIYNTKKHVILHYISASFTRSINCPALTSCIFHIYLMRHSTSRHIMSIVTGYISDITCKQLLFCATKMAVSILTLIHHKTLQG